MCSSYFRLFIPMKLSTFTNIKLNSRVSPTLPNTVFTQFLSRGVVGLFTLVCLLNFVNQFSAGSSPKLRFTTTSKLKAFRFERKQRWVKVSRLSYINTAYWFTNAHAAIRVIGNRQLLDNTRYSIKVLRNFTVLRGVVPNFVALSSRNWISTFRRAFKTLYRSARYYQSSDWSKLSRHRNPLRRKYKALHKRYRFWFKGAQIRGRRTAVWYRRKAIFRSYRTAAL